MVGGAVFRHPGKIERAYIEGYARQRIRNAFTRIELLVMISIIAFRPALAAIVPFFFPASGLDACKGILALKYSDKPKTGRLVRPDRRLPPRVADPALFHTSPAHPSSRSDIDKARRSSRIFLYTQRILCRSPYYSNEEDTYSIHTLRR